MRYLILCVVALYFVSCDNELDLVADFKETPVVYGLVDPGDTMQYIRVERAFVDKQISANEIAQRPDSLYYDDITVKLVRQLTGEEYTLERIDGNVAGYPREDGVFATAPNYLYTIRTDAMELVKEEIIELKIDGIFEDRAVTAEANVLEEPFILNPQQDGVISFLRNRKVALGWNEKGDPTIYSIEYRFNITEEKDGQFTDRELVWIVETNLDKTLAEIDGIQFYSFMLGALDKDPEVKRTMGTAEFRLISANQTVADYIRVGQANIGLTSSGEIPTFTNMSDGLGLFGSSLTVFRTNLSVSEVTLDSLRMSPLTKDLNFE